MGATREDRVWYETMSARSSPTPLVLQVARLFIKRKLTNVEIASRLGMSRFRVARLIDQALADGTVRIEFRDDPHQDIALGRAIEDRFGLDLCVVAGRDRPATVDDVARLAGGVVDGLLSTGEAIGIAWGTTVARVVEAMPVRIDPSIDVVQLAGSSTSLDAATDPGDLTRVLAARLGGRAHRIHAPAFVDSAELRSALTRQPEAADTAARFDHLAVAIVGIGAFGPATTRPPRRMSSSSLLRSGALSDSDLARLIA